MNMTAIASMQIHSGLFKTTPIIRNSCFKSISCQAGTVSMRSRKTNLYEVLSLDSNDVSLDKIKKAYREKALEFHPDTRPASSKEESTSRFIEIKLAYETLSDPVSRELYDFELGLMNSKDRSYGSWCMDTKRAFSREIWEGQLQGLKERSKHRPERRRNQCVTL